MYICYDSISFVHMTPGVNGYSERNILEAVTNYEAENQRIVNSLNDLSTVQPWIRDKVCVLYMFCFSSICIVVLGSLHHPGLFPQLAETGTTQRCVSGWVTEAIYVPSGDGVGPEI